eukprot:403352460
MVEPCTLPCNHVFCIQCINQLVQQKTQCPMCRFDFPIDYNPQVDLKLQAKILSQNEIKFKERLEELKTQGLLEGNQIRIKFIYGNDHKPVQNPKKVGQDNYNANEWTTFVRLVPNQGLNSNDSIKRYIQKVRFGLHPTFGVTEIDVKSAPFQMTRIGWGVFNIPIEIFFRRDTGKKETIKLDHYLSFQGQGSSRIFTIAFDKEKLDQISYL